MILPNCRYVSEKACSAMRDGQTARSTPTLLQSHDNLEESNIASRSGLEVRKRQQRASAGTPRPRIRALTTGLIYPVLLPTRRQSERGAL